MSHTYATLAVTVRTYDEIAAKLLAADYSHAFERTYDPAAGCMVDVIDMHGIALVVAPRRGEPKK